MPLEPPPLPRAIKRRLLELYDNEPMRSRVELREMVTQHRRRTEAIASNDPFVDIGKAIKVERSCLALLDAWQTLPAPGRAWIQVACLYFAASDDADDDFESVTGFDDDAEVVNHIAVLVGLSRLAIPRK
ncbi:MAG: hypothetical protein KDA24_26080 [Deltaproteobacteria bacterium]|nr:hypothetical protein [Deltaproteobacteria bacterium]